MKIGEMEITALLVLMVAELSRGDTFYTREDPCINLCENLLIFQSIDSSNNIYVKSCCQRGCRFFNLVDLHPERESNSLNGTRDACETSCTEAYTNLQDRYVCSVGCDFMAKAKNPRISELLSRLPISVFYRIEEDIDSNVLLMSPDVPENDILTDPGLRKELLPGWWDTDGFKLPQTYVKTVPMDAGTVDYALSSDYSGETEQTSMSGSDWFHCALKQIRIPYWDIGVPYWLFAFAIAVFIMLSMMWLCLSTGDVPTTSRKDVLIDMSSSPKVALYMPDEAPLYKEPPPKYEYSSNHCACQMLMTAICGLIQMYYTCGMYKANPKLMRPPGFYKHMTLVGCTRFATVVLGLVSLNYVAVSFTETIKSSAPLFTVLISRYLLGEHTGLYVNLSLIPVMGGLALCSINEISFDLRGFIAAMATNVTECLQNVYSKMLISGDNFKYTPAELQFYTSLASIVVQIPVSILLVDLPTLEHSLSFKLFAAFLLNGVFFHFQSITAYVLMDYISPVTHSVANTAKRAFLIWLSVLLFNNPVTGLSALGTSSVIAGVLLYNRAQEYDKMNKTKLRHSSKINL